MQRDCHDIYSRWGMGSAVPVMISSGGEGHHKGQPKKAPYAHKAEEPLSLLPRLTPRVTAFDVAIL